MSVLVEMPKYEAYKDSRCEWLGDIPEHWQQKRFKFIATVKKGKLPKKIVNSPQTGTFPYLSMEYLRGGVANQYVVDSRSLIIESNEILLLWDGSNSGEFIKSRKGVISSTIALVNYTGIIKSFAWYVSHLVETKLRSTTIGMGIPHVNGNELANSWLTAPPHQEQTNIANFLDKKTAQINDAIAIKQRQIELLKERKQIIIQKAVTQGLDPDVSMRDSGVDWIGNIPGHWELLKLKHLFKEVNKRTKTGEETLFSLRMVQGLVPHDSVSDKAISNSSLIDYKIVERGQLVMNRMRAAIGIFGVAKNYGLVSPDYAILNIKITANADYFLRLFKTSLMGTQFRLNSKGLGTGSSGFMRLYTESFGDIKIPFPSVDEQIEINKYIESQSQNIDDVINLQNTQIKNLKEYKTTLINSAVTGKIKIPEIQLNAKEAQ